MLKSVVVVVIAVVLRIYFCWIHLYMPEPTVLLSKSYVYQNESICLLFCNKKKSQFYNERIWNVYDKMQFFFFAINFYVTTYKICYATKQRIHCGIFKRKLTFCRNWFREFNRNNATVISETVKNQIFNSSNRSEYIRSSRLYFLISWNEDTKQPHDTRRTPHAANMFRDFIVCFQI